jgi:hypothetical protein
LSARPFLIAFVACAGLAACNEKASSDQPVAPTDTGACYRMGTLAGAKTKFSLVSVGDGNMETCAVHIEGVRLREGHDVIGAYEGRFIFASETELTGSRSYADQRFPLFSPGKRDEIDRDLKQLLDQEKAKAAKDAKPKA